MARSVGDFPLESHNIDGWTVYCDCGHVGTVRMRDHRGHETTGRIWRALRCTVCGRGRPDVRVYVTDAAIRGEPGRDR